MFKRMRIFLNSQQMEYNNLRNQNEITNNGIKPSIKQIEKIIPIQTEDEKESCRHFFRINQDVSRLCQEHYTSEYLKCVIETSDFLIQFYNEENPDNIVALSLFESKSKKSGKIMNIVLVCATANSQMFEEIIVQSLQKYALTQKQPFLQISPRTHELREILIKQGFESIFESVEVKEVFEKEIELSLFISHEKIEPKGDPCPMYFTQAPSNSK